MAKEKSLTDKLLHPVLKALGINAKKGQYTPNQQPMIRAGDKRSKYFKKRN